MECPRVCVIDNSPSVLETIPIVLGGTYGVRCFTADDYLRDPSQLSEADLLIVADDALPAESLTSLTQGPPILWLQTRRGPPPVTTGHWAQVPRSFTPEDLRARIRALLASRGRATAWSPWSVIAYPVIPESAIQVAQRASSSDLPVLICGEPGSGKGRLARAIHALGRGGRFVSVAAANCHRAALRAAASEAVGNLTVLVSDVAQLDGEGRAILTELLDCGGFSSDAGWHAVRLMCATATRFEALRGAPGMEAALFYRLGVLPIDLPALRERPYDIPALAHYIATELGRRVGGEPVSFTPRALHRLMHYLWFGNLAELETVLARTLTLVPSRIIDANDLLFGYGPLPAHHHPPPPAPSPAASAEAAPIDAAELIINELAHEFKNPMVTIKTVAQHLERLLADEAGRQQVARLTGEAVDRMDRTLENLLQFTRFRTPAPEEIAVGALLAPVVTDLSPTLAERRVLVNYQPAETGRAFVDPPQVIYAFENLLRTITRDLVEGQTLTIRPMKSATAVLFEFPTPQQSIGTKLVELVNGQARSEASASPLGLRFAKVLLERNAGRIDIRATADTTTITVSLPSKGEITPGNGKTASLDS